MDDWYIISGKQKLTTDYNLKISKVKTKTLAVLGKSSNKAKFIFF